MAADQPISREAARASIPAHVPPELVVDFDCFQPAPVIDDLQITWSRLKAQVPKGLAWTPRNGGHWITLTAEDIKTVQVDFERFSHSEIIVPPDPDHKGEPLYPIDFDPPVQKPYRLAIMSQLLPTKLGPLEDRARELTIKLVEGFKPKGGCEFVREFATIVPVAVFLEMMDLPLEDRDLLLPFADAVARGDTAEAHAWGHENVEKYVREKVTERQRNLSDDFMSRLIQADINGRPATFEEAVSMIHLLVLGGLDTVANMMAFFMLFLAKHPSHRRQLVDNPALITTAVDELIRRHGLVNTARRIVQDTELQGVQLKTGDMIQVPNMLYGLDETLVEDPFTVDFSRRSCPHAAFGNGPHVCVGQHLARRELRVLLEEWLPRIPDFQIRPGTTPEIRSGMVSGPVSLELSWDC